MSSKKATRSSKHKTPHHLSHPHRPPHMLRPNEYKPSDEDVTCLVIGDPHLKYRQSVTNSQYADAVLKVASEKKPDFIVILGDILDTHESVKIPPCKIATEIIISGLAKIAPTFVIIGNHDLVDSNQFLTDNHIFNPLKRWKNVTIVDYPIFTEIKSKEFIMCPFVPPGRFVEALNKLIEEGHTWDLADCIFGHQEFYGCTVVGHKLSTTGDKWDTDYPPVISGHIHKEHTVGTNIYYPGSSTQSTYSEDSDKYIWFVTFPEDDSILSNQPSSSSDHTAPRRGCDSTTPGCGSMIGHTQHFLFEKISLGLKSKKLITINIEDLDDFDVSMCETYHIKLKIRTTQSQYREFKKGKVCNILKKHGILFAPDYIIDTSLGDISQKQLEQMNNVSKLSYGSIFSRIVDASGDCDVKSTFEDIFKDDPEISSHLEFYEPELVFADSPCSDELELSDEEYGESELEELSEEYYDENEEREELSENYISTSENDEEYSDLSVGDLSDE